MQIVLNRASSRNFTMFRSVLQTRDAGHLAVALVSGERGPGTGRLIPGGNRSGAQLAFCLEPVLEIASVRGTGGEEELVRAVGDVGVAEG
jgi:hypothetical protein